jgi:hypothetical protein
VCHGCLRVVASIVGGCPDVYLGASNARSLEWCSHIWLHSIGHVSLVSAAYEHADFISFGGYHILALCVEPCILPSLMVWVCRGGMYFRYVRLRMLASLSQSRGGKAVKLA